ncbi:hypothetical protein H0V99_01745 [Candidatus Saccharibacteria bacterium]|nr:hypothetical protein [Candidatus Saccharibacteria bacterium]
MSTDHNELYQSHSDRFTPTAAELDAHRQLEQFVEFKFIDTAGISESRQSRVSVMEYEVGGEYFKVLWKRMAAGKGLDGGEAVLLDGMLMPYRGELIKQGWNIPETFFHAPTRINGETQIFSYDQFIPGGDGEKMIINPDVPNFRKWFMIRRVIETLAGYDEAGLSRGMVAGEDVTILPHGLDLKLANVVAEADGKVYFVDLFGPKQFNENGEWAAYSSKLDTLPPESLKAVCATREGAILRFYRLAEQLWSENIGISKDYLKEGFLTQISQSTLPQEETAFIEEQVINNFQWLDIVYSEKRV